MHCRLVRILSGSAGLYSGSPEFLFYFFFLINTNCISHIAFLLKWILPDDHWLLRNFSSDNGDVSLDRGFVRGYPLSGYGCFSVSPLDTGTHCPKWVEERAVDLADFQGKGTPKPGFHQSECAHLKDVCS